MPVTLIASPHPLRNDLYSAEIADGATLLGTLGNLPDSVTAQVDGVPWARSRWVEPLPDGAMVNLCATPQDNAGRAIALVAIAVLAAYTGGAAATAAGAVTSTGALTTAGLAIQAGVAAAVTFAGSLAVNALIPPNMPEQPASSSGGKVSQSLTGTRNQADPYGVVPRVYGNPRWYPKLAAMPITEIAGNDQYLRMMLCLGYGPLEIGGRRVGQGSSLLTSDNASLGNALRIGETNIDEYEDVEWQIGLPGQLTLDYPDISEESVGVALNRAGGLNDDRWVADGVFATRTTAPDTTEISVDLVFAAGLWSINDNGSTSATAVRFRVEYLNKAGGGWQSVDGTWQINGPTKDTLRVNKRWRVAQGQYDVRVTRDSSYHGGTEVVNSDCTWSVLRSIQPGRAYNGNHVLLALRIRANDQLNGVIDQLNVKTQAVVRVWNDQTTRFDMRATSNPAWAYLDVLTGEQVNRPIGDNQIDFDGLVAWANFCESQGLKYHWVHDSAETLFERSKSVAAAGQASFCLQDGLFGVVRDDPDEPTVQVITPRNATGFQNDRQFKDLPHALRVKYIDPETWNDAERIVYREGYDPANATRFEDFSTQGVASAEEAYHHGSYHMRQAMLRPETFTVQMDWENLAAMRGNRVRLAYDAIKVGLSYGRVKQVNGDTIVLDEGIRWETSRTYGIRVRRSDGEQVVYPVTSPIIGDSHILRIIGDDADIEVGDLLLYGELDKESIDCKISRIEPGADFTASLTLVPAATDIYDFSAAPIYDPGITNPIPLDRIPPPVPVITAVRGDESATHRNADGSFQTLIRISYGFTAQLGLPSLEVEARYRIVGVSQWQNAGPFAASGNMTIVNVDDGENYQIQLRAKNGALYSGWSENAVLTVTGQAVTRPTAVEFNENTFDILIRPKGLYPNAQWEFYYSLVPLASGNIESLGTRLGVGTTWLHTGLSPNTTYYYYIRGWSAFYTSAWLGVQATTDNDAEEILKVLSGKIKQEQLFSDLQKSIEQITTNSNAINQEIIDRKEGDEYTISQIDTVQTQLGSDIASVAQEATTAISAQGRRINAMWALRVDVNGLVGGMGLSNDGKKVDIIFRSDTFAIAPPDLPDNSVIPFIFTDSTLYLKEALIQSLTFTKLKASDGSFIVQDGKIRADYIQADQIVANQAQSANYQAGVSGWRLGKNGDFQLNNSNGGGRTEMTGSGMHVYDSAGRLRVRIGIW